MKKFTLYITGFLLLFSFRTFSQNLAESEAQIVRLYSHISPTRPDSQNKAVHDSISALLNSALQSPEAFDYPFNELKFMGKILSGDKKLRILSWNMVRSDATSEYFGFVIHKNATGQINVFKLTEMNMPPGNLQAQSYDYNNWPGYLVYEIIDFKAEGQTHYILLGYSPENLFISRKFIDVVWFQHDSPLFGKPLFHYNKQTLNRIVFEYSAKARMSLTWNKKLNMIVFDHLSPSSPSYTGNFQFYGPDMSFDGLVFEKGAWEHRQNIDVRN